jgi:hypothetical protein
LHHTSAEGLLSKMGKAVSKLNNKEITWSKNRLKEGGGVAQEEEHLCTKNEALSSNPITVPERGGWI